MKRLYFVVALMLLAVGAYGNDGSFTVSGNQLIPVEETDISVKKEVLTINRSAANPHQAEISVYYEFYNPGAAKTITVGFEADMPDDYIYGDMPVSYQQPYIHYFTVDMNGQNLPYQVAVVSDSVYYQNGQLKALTEKQVKEQWDKNGENFRYVYHFQADFKRGLNIIKHTYTCDFSSFNIAYYEFSYILSAAMRWGNKQIDDFTLNINMGDDQRINIGKSFFDKADEWTIAGTGKKRDMKTLYYETESPDDSDSCAGFYIKKGYLIFQKQNFKPKGELLFTSPHSTVVFADTFNYKTQPYIGNEIFDISDGRHITASDEISKKIMRNLPFAKRGYIFSTPELQTYFERQLWYFPDPDYQPDMAKLSEEEQKWIEYWSK